MSTIILPVSGGGGPVTIAPFSTIGGVVLPQAGLIVLGASTFDGGNYATFRLPNGTSGYTVTGGKKLYIYAAQWFGASATTEFDLGYGTSDIGYNSAALPTGPVYQYGNSSGPVLAGGVAATMFQAATSFSIPAGNYPLLIVRNGSMSVQIYGYEV